MACPASPTTPPGYPGGRSHDGLGVGELHLATETWRSTTWRAHGFLQHWYENLHEKPDVGILWVFQRVSLCSKMGRALELELRLAKWWESFWNWGYHGVPIFRQTHIMGLNWLNHQRWTKWGTERTVSTCFNPKDWMVGNDKSFPWNSGLTTLKGL